MSRPAWLILLALVAFGASLGGVLAGRELIETERRSESDIHSVLHDKLDLNPAQLRKIEDIEQRLVVRRAALDVEMRAANAHLAAAIDAEHGYGPQVTAAIDHTHAVMGDIQKETLEHVFAMRAILNPKQAAIFDQTVVKALTAEPQ